ncbi:MAG TPA: cytochrome c biogenesis protein ResB [Candidatus Krumholzibacteria bacterium]|nr:cytochrome c biogenesis protein ResB [Candidatus Krumholzibacteria bacterium]HRX51582.1 cytochrome c biogenesis protein ResB [Candidatus Krumholzibacteria bacterium]
MKRFFQNPVIAALASLRLTVPLLVIFAVAIGKATFIESQMGAEGARGLVYNALWFEVLLGLFCLNLILRLFKDMPYKPRQTGFVIVHISMIWILISAGITRWYGYEGIMPIREGSSTNFIWSREPHLQASMGDSFDSYEVRLYQPGQTVAHDVTLEGGSYRLAVEDYWPRFEMKQLPAAEGPPALTMAMADGDALQEVTLVGGESERVDGVRYSVVRGDAPPPGGSSAYGDLRVRVDGRTGTLPVSRPLEGELELGGWTFTVTEFQASFRVGGGTDFDSPLDNPMIRVGITAPDGSSGERLLFAYHPDFSMNHGGGEDAFADLDLVYGLSQGVTFALADDGTVRARAAGAYQKLSMEDAQPVATYPGGEAFEVEFASIYRASGSGAAFVVSGAMQHVQMQPGLSADPNAPAAARVSLTAPDGTTASDIVFKDDGRGAKLSLGGKEAVVKLGSIKIPLPYSVHLDDFLLLTYPGSRNPASYESHVRLYDEAQGIDGRPVRIYMNHPLTHRGFKHFQSSYDPDEKGTVLSVNYDPGKWPTYIGYILISVGFVLVFARDQLWPRKDNS